MNRFLAIALFLIVGLNFAAQAQTIHLQGNVFSYNAKKIMLLKKAQKDLSFEGPVANAMVSVTGKDYSTSYATGINGYFSITLDYPGIYQVSVKCSGYSSVSFVLDYISAGNKSNFESLFFILKQDENSNVKLGRLEIKSGNLAFLEGSSENPFLQDLYNSNVNLVEKAVNINNHGGGGKAFVNTLNKKGESQKSTDKIKQDSALAKQQTSFNAKKWDAVEKFKSDDVDSLKSNLVYARQLLKVLSPESEDYTLLSQQVSVAEQKIKDKESIIALKEKDISNSNRIILYLLLFLLFLSFSLGLLYYFFREKKIFASKLSENNTKISDINSRVQSSIRYASIIQESFLPPPSALSKTFKNSFLFSKPKDILSGDFHWFAEKNNHKLLIVADCTGHGVPGAMLTVLGNRLLDEIISQKGEVLPSRILMQLNASIMETFSSTKEHLDYGIDISILSLNEKTGELFFSGIANGIYQLSDEKLRYYSATPKSIGPDLVESDVTDQLISYEKGDSFYLFTDGFADQFKGNDPERTKYNIKRFENLILQVGKSNDLTTAPAIFEKELSDWMGKENQQVDDICIMGFRV